MCVIEEVTAFAPYDEHLGEVPMHRFIREMLAIERNDGGGLLYESYCTLQLCASPWVAMRRPRSLLVFYGAEMGGERELPDL